MANPNAGDPSELVVVAFPGETKAYEVLQVLQRMNKEHLVDLHNAAVVVRHGDGKITFHETHDPKTQTTTVAGALAGGLAGMLRGNVVEGALLGAGAGFVAGKVLDLGFKDDYLKQLGESLAPGTSAIVAAVEFQHVDEAIRELDQFSGGRVLRATLPQDVAQRLAAAVED